MQTAMPLQLRYAFTSTPDPIRASAAGANPNSVDLEVMASNSEDRPVILQKVVISIPVGADVPGTLSAAPSLPPPVCDTSIPWELTAAGSDITIRPKIGQSGTLAGTIVFTVRGIHVNEVAGVVPITITEFSGAGGKEVDAESYKLVKRPSDFAVVAFWAEPNALGDLNQRVTLKWVCSDQGHEYNYAVRSDGWQPRDCLGTGQCFTCKDGAAGVRTAPLFQTTTFLLDVIDTDPTGRRVVNATLTTTVQVIVPSMAETVSLRQYLSGRVVRLHWLARNAVRCTLMDDAQIVSSRAPTDTYEKGQLVVLSEDRKAHELGVMAHGAAGARTALLRFEDVVWRSPPQPYRIKAAVVGLALAPDGTRAVVLTETGSLLVLNFELQHVKEITRVVGQGSRAVAVTSDGIAVLVGDAHEKDVLAIDLGTGALQPRLSVGGTPIGITTMPDGRALVLTREGEIRILDPRSRTVSPGPYVGSGATNVAFVGGQVVVPHWGARTVEVRPLSQAGSMIATPGHPQWVAGAPGGTQVLVGTDQGVTVLDTGVSGRMLTIATLDCVGGAVSNEGMFALLVHRSGVHVSVLDLAGCASAGQLKVGGRASAVACTPDGQRAIVAVSDTTSSTLVML